MARQPDERRHIPRRLTPARRVWWSSLPLRMISITLSLALIVLVAGGMFLMQRVGDGILTAKRQSSVAEATAVVNRMQTELEGTDLRTSSLYERLTQLADEAASPTGHYHIIIQGSVSGLISAGVSADSVPQNLADTIASSDGVFVTPTTLRFTDTSHEQIPGVVVGTTLWVPGQDMRIPIYFLFSLEQEVHTLTTIKGVVALTGVLIVMGLGFTTFLATRAVASPIRRASGTARRLADGHLDERMPVRGTDDLAKLATSINEMAAQLQGRIVDLEQLSTLQQQFVSDVSHELRTPLTTVRMAADVIADQMDEADPAAQRSAHLLMTQLDRFEDMLSDLLEISRIDAGAATLALEEVDIVDLVQAEVQAAQPLATRMHTQLRVHVFSGATAEIDAIRVRRILRNLLSNAIEYSECRLIDVTVGYDLHAVAVTVRDHGVGLEAWQVDKLFGRFWRADPSRVRTVGGTGLGLAISHDDAELHGGRLEAWGRPGDGAQFRLTLPRRRGTELTSSPLPLVPSDRQEP